MPSRLPRKQRRRSPRRRAASRPRRTVAKAGLISELDVQKGVIDYLSKLGWYVCHIPAGGEDPAHRGRMERQGYVPGFPDLYCEPPDPALPPILIECKRPGKRPTADQRVSHVELRARGREVWIIDDPEQLWRDHGVWPTPDAASDVFAQLGRELPAVLFGTPRTRQRANAVPKQISQS